MTDTTQQPILSPPGESAELNLGGSTLLHRIRSDDTGGAFSVVEFVSAPGEGVGVHTHTREDELVYLLQGQIKVTLGDQQIDVPAGATALLPRGIPHGYVNTGDTPTRLLAVLMPGRLDRFFVELDELLKTDGEHEQAIAALAARHGLSFAA